MPQKFIFLIIGLFFGTGAGFLLSVSSGAELDSHDHVESDLVESTDQETLHDHTTHNHSKLVELPIGPDAPSLTVSVEPDTVSGWNLHIIPKNFRFAPEALNREHVVGQGHAHVYVNGVKLMRVYANWAHIPELPTGAVEVAVSLNTNSHNPISVGGVPLIAAVNVQVAE